jgi:hypothetical protein
VLESAALSVEEGNPIPSETNSISKRASQLTGVNEWKKTRVVYVCVTSTPESYITKLTSRPFEAKLLIKESL